MGINIRRAVESDCPRLLELVKELATYERAPNEVSVNLEHFTQSGFGHNPVWWAFVAESDEDQKGMSPNIFGFALYYIRYSTWKGQRMYLEDIIVTREARGKGIGHLLMDRLIEEAREKKFGAIAWQVLDWNASAIDFYRKYDAQIDDAWLNCSISI